MNAWRNIHRHECGDLSEREALFMQLEWVRRQQAVAVLRHRRAEAASLMDLLMGKSASGR